MREGNNMRNIKRKKTRTINDILLDDYESAKYLGQNDTRLSMGYGEECEDDNIELDTIEGMQDIDYLYEDATSFVGSSIIGD